MAAKWEINGREVSPIYLLMKEAEDLNIYVDSMPTDHPDLEYWVKKCNEVYGKVKEARACALN